MAANDQAYVPMDRDAHGFGDNGILAININATGASANVLVKDATQDDTVVDTTAGFFYLIFYEDADNTGTFSNVDNDDNSNLDVITHQQLEEQLQLSIITIVRNHSLSQMTLVSLTWMKPL